ncbi:MAG TPA: chromosome partitioning protein ParB, partial [Allocoleopsis sp.]
RREAALRLGFTHVPVKIFVVGDEVAAEIAAASNLQREDLNPLEETDGILELLSLKLNKSQEDVIKLFYQLGNQGKGKNNVVLTPEWEVVQSVFASVARITPETFRVQRLPLLNLPEEILDALRQGQLEYTKARSIARVKDETQRLYLLKDTVTHNFSKREIDEKVKLLNSTVSTEVFEEDNIPERLKETYTRLKNARIWRDPRKRKQLEKLLVQIEALLE